MLTKSQAEMIATKVTGDVPAEPMQKRKINFLFYYAKYNISNEKWKKLPISYTVTIKLQIVMQST